jgi:dTDP-4-dehydrorhamnose 3,5-epimerase
MIIEKTHIEGLLVIKPRIFSDNRGQFIESFNASIQDAIGKEYKFIQDNESVSKIGVLRGLHFQNPPWEQGKLVRVSSGRVWDVAVDIRKNSPTYLQHYGLELSGENKFLFWIPPGFAHGFLVLEENSVFSYKCTNFYNKEAEDSLLWNDPLLNIQWPIKHDLIISDKDLEAQTINKFDSKFFY